MLIVYGKEVFTELEELVDPKHTALLIIDLQKGYVVPGGLFDKRGEDKSAVVKIIPSVKNVLESARRSGVLVIFVQFTRYPDYSTESPASLHMFLLHSGYSGGDPTEKLPTHNMVGSREWEIIDDIAPLPSEIIVRKHRSSAFIGTDLDQILRSNSIKTVTIVGSATEACVLATAKDAQSLDYYTVLLNDCISTGHKQRHDAAFLIFSWDMDVVGSKDVINIWDNKMFTT